MFYLLSAEFVSSVPAVFGWYKKGEKNQGWINFSAKTTQRCTTLPKLAPPSAGFPHSPSSKAPTNAIYGSRASDGWAQTWVRLRFAFACFL